MNYKNFFNEIKTKLETIPELKRVSIFNNADISSGFPFVNISGFSKTREKTATCLIEENGNVELTLYQEINADNSGAVRGNNVVLDIMQKIDNVIDTNPTMNNQVDFIQLTNGQMGYVDTTLNCRTYQFTLSYKTNVKISINN